MDLPIADKVYVVFLQHAILGSTISTLRAGNERMGRNGCYGVGKRFGRLVSETRWKTPMGQPNKLRVFRMSQLHLHHP